MKRNLADGLQNVEVSKPIPCEKTIQEQLEIMEMYTNVHQMYSTQNKAWREYHCLRVLFPSLFRSIQDLDLICGRLDFLPIGFGSVTSIGGVGHYCVFHKLRAFKEQFQDPIDQARVDVLYDYWQKHDVKAIYCNEVLNETTIGRFIDCRYPFMATARLSGMMLDYNKLMSLGVSGLIDLLESQVPNDFIQASIACLYLFKDVIRSQIQSIDHIYYSKTKTRQQELDYMRSDLEYIMENKPKTFHQALQLFWLYALCAGCINYGRLDIVLGPYLYSDLKNGVLTKEQAIAYLKSLWQLIENRRTTVNGRIIVGGKGRPNVEACDVFTRLCLQVCKELRYVEPQFTLRFDHTTPKDILDMAYDCIASGATYPTLYNDDVNVKSVMYAMQVRESIAQQYVPFGCGEYVIQGKSVGTPNTLLNMLKILQIAMNEGYDPMDGLYKAGPIVCKPLNQLCTFEDLMHQYEELQDFYFDLSIQCQKRSYSVMNEQVSFLFTSILMDDCIGRGKALLDGGVEILGGTNETYGNINASDSLYAIKKLVYDENKYTLTQINQACLKNFEGFEKIRNDLWKQDKYGNDESDCDDLACRCYEYVAKGLRQRGIDAGLGYYLVVISNNQTNTDWGHHTHASADGRKKGMYLNPANNPQGNAVRNGPTSTLNSLVKFDTRLHGGSVQNMKFTPRMMKEDKEKVEALFQTYFNKGGCQLMVTVVDSGVLQDAQLHPENHQDLLVRVAGYSARFIDLSSDIQEEIISRELYD